MPRILISNLHYYLVQNVRHLPRKHLELFIAQNIIPHISLLFYKWYNEIKCITLWKFTLLPGRLGLLFRVSCPSGQQIGGWEVKQQGPHLLYLHLNQSIITPRHMEPPNIFWVIVILLGQMWIDMSPKTRLSFKNYRTHGKWLHIELYRFLAIEQRTSGKYILVFGEKFPYRFLPFKSWREVIYVLPSFTICYQEKCYNYINQKVKQRMSIQLSKGMTKMRTEKKKT